MPLLRSLLWRAAKTAATDPRVRQGAVDAYKKARPHADRAAREFRDTLRETSPLEDPRGFAARYRDRLRGK